MNYPAYKQARDASWQFLIDNDITSLPISFGEICRKNNIGLYRDISSNYFKDNEQGVTFIYNKRFNIVVNGKDSFEIQRFTIAHELGHIYMRHPMTDDKYGRSFGAHHHPGFDIEYQAERFAMNILAPACVLWGLDIHSADDISKICNISLDDARYRAKRMSALYKRKKFLSSSLEKKVFEQFKTFFKCRNQILHSV